VQAELKTIFRRYGLPKAMLMDNGAPWGACGYEALTPLSVWFIRLGIQLHHGLPNHPQTQGKDERFHRTLELELLRTRQYDDLRECQSQFDPWRDMYNQERPHEALGLQVPASRYQVSPVAYPESLPPIQYAPGEIVRQVRSRGEIKFEGHRYYLGESF